MSKLAIISIILLLAGIGLAFSSSNAPRIVENLASTGNGHDLTNNTNTQNFSCSNNTSCPANLKGKTNEGNVSCAGQNKKSYALNCTCQNGTICAQNNCTFKNCACPKSGAGNNSRRISCAGNGPCPVNKRIA